MQHRLRDFQPANHAARVGLHQLAGGFGQAHELQRFRDARFALARRGMP